MRTLFLTLVATGCVPVLESPNTPDTDSVTEWIAPENTWESNVPPESLTAEGYNSGQVIPDLRMMDQHGNEVSLWQFYGMVVLVDISTMWCSPCQDLAHDVDATWNEYSDQGFMYITMLPQNNVNVVPSQEDLQTWASDYSITAPILSDAENFSGDIMAPTDAFPRLLLLNRDMSVEVEAIQPATDFAIRKAVEAVL